MNRHVKMSAVLIVLILAAMMIFVGCDELEQAVVDIETQIEESVQSALDTAKADLEAAKAELNATMDANKAGASADLQAAIEELNAAIDAAEKAAADANAADKAELVEAIATAKAEAVAAATELVNAAKEELNASIEGNKTEAAEALAAAVEALNAAIATAEQTAADANAADKAELTAAIATAKAEAVATATELVNAAKTELNATIAANKTAAAGELSNAVTTLNAAIEAASKVAADTDAANKAALESALADAQAALEESVDAVQANLDAAVTELKALVESGDAASAAALDEAVEKLNAAVKEANEIAKKSDYELEETLRRVIAETVDNVHGMVDTIYETLDKNVAELNTLIAANKDASDKALADKAAEIAAAIEVAKQLASDDNAALKATLEAADAALQVAINKVQDNLDEAVENLENTIADNKQLAADELADAVAALNTAIEAAKTVASEDNATLKADLEAADAALQGAIDAVEADLAAAVAELNSAIAENKTAIETHVTNVAGEVERLEQLIAALQGTDNTLDDWYINNEELAEAVDALNVAIEALETDLADKTADLQAQINSNKELANTNLGAKVDELTALITAAQNAADAAQGAADVADDRITSEVNTLNVTINELKIQLNEAIGTAQDACIAIEGWNTAAGAVKDALAYVATQYAKYNNVLYSENLDEIEANYKLAQVKVIRAIDSAAVQAAKDEFDAYLGGLETAAEVIYRNILAIAADADSVVCTAAQRTALANVRAYIDMILAVDDDVVKTSITAFEVSEGVVVNLDELCASYEDKYAALKAEGEAIMAQMNAVVAAPLSLTLKAGNVDIDAAYDAWTVANEVTEIDGFVATKENYDAKKDAIAAYETEGNALKAEIDAWLEANSVIVLSNDHSDRIDTLIADYNAWVVAGNNDSVGYIDGLADSKVNLDAADARIEALIAEGIEFRDEMIEFCDNTTSLTLEAVAENLDARYAAWIAENTAGDWKPLVPGLAKTNENDSNKAEENYAAKKVAVAELRADGEALRDNILAEVNNGLIVIAHKENVTTLIAAYNTWSTNHSASVALVDGLAEAKVQIDAKNARIAVLEEAKGVAAGINNQINAIILNNTGDATMGVKNALASITAQINAWIETYGLGTEDELDNTNYNMVNHALFAEKDAKFDELVGEFERTFAAFKEAYDAIGEEINLLSGDEIAAARAAYNAWRDQAALGTFNYELTDGEKPGDYTVAMLQKESEFKLLVKNALEAYNARFDADLTVNTVTIYDQAAVELIESWYAEFAVEFEDAYVFETGYVLSDTLTVTAEDYAKVVALRAAFDELVAAKIAETAEVNALIAALGDITTDSRAAIDAALAAREAWLAGTNVPEGYAEAQFAIDAAKDVYTVDDATLDAADAACTALEDEAAALKALIEALPEYTVSTDIADDTARADYQALIDAIDEAYAQFVENNDGNRDNVTEAEFAKVDAGKLALVKYDAVETLKDEAAAWTAEGNFVEAVENVLAFATAAIDADTVADADAVAAVADEYSTKLAALNALQNAYTAKVAAANNTANAKTAIGVVCDKAIEDIVDDANNGAVAYAAFILADTKFSNVIAICDNADKSLGLSTNDLADAAISELLDLAIEAISTAADNGSNVVNDTTAKFEDLVALGNDADIQLDASVNADADDAIAELLEAAIASIKATASDDVVAEAKAQFADLVEIGNAAEDSFTASDVEAVSNAIQAVLEGAIATIKTAADDDVVAETIAKFNNLVDLSADANDAYNHAIYDVTLEAITVVLDAAIESIKTAANDDVVALADAKFDALVAVDNNAESYSASLDDNAVTTIGAVLEDAVEAIKNAADAAAVDSAVALANAKYVSIDDVYAAYVLAQADIDAADEINLGALATAYTDYLAEVEGAVSEHAVNNATSAAKEIFNLIVESAKA